jgi:WD40 repeat protein
VLLLSEDAARSEWVGREIEHWVANHDVSKILPVVTDGEFGWADGDVVGSSVPPALRGVFSEEPRWVDLRFARGEEQLDLSNPDFSAAVADVASAIRGIPKDELASEEVRQHRRTVRTAWAAGAVVLLLGIAATVAAIVAVGQSNEAQNQRDEAQRLATAEADARAQAVANAEEARRQEEQAEQLAEIARQREEAALEAEAEALESERKALDAQAVSDAQRDRADEEAQVSYSRELAAAAVSVLEDDPELSMMLALESIAATPEGQQASRRGVIALRQAVVNSRLLKRFEIGAGDQTYAQISRSGSTLFVSARADQRVYAIDIDSGRTIWTYSDLTTVDHFVRVSLSGDGRYVALEVQNWEAEGPTDIEVDEDGHDAHPSRIVILDQADGSVKATLEPETCDDSVAWLRGFSPDGRWLAVAIVGPECSLDPDGSWVSVYATETWQEHSRWRADGAVIDQTISFSADSSRVLIFGSEGEATLRTFPDGAVIRSFGVWPRDVHASLSPDGSRIVVWSAHQTLDLTHLGPGIELRPVLVDAETSERIAYLDAVDEFPSNDAISFSPDGSVVIATTREADLVFDAANGRLLARLGRGFTWSHSFNGGTTAPTLVVTSHGGRVLIWSLGSGLDDLGEALEVDGYDPWWFQPGAVREGPLTAVYSFADNDAGTVPLTTIVDPVTRSVTRHMQGWGIQLPDGRFVLEQHSIGADGDNVAGPLIVWDPALDETTRLTECTVPLSSLDSQLSNVECPDGDAYFPFQQNSAIPGLAASRDGTFIAATSHWTFDQVTQLVRVWSSDTLDVTSQFEVPWDYALFPEAGSDWLAFGVEGSIRVLDLMGSHVATLSSDGYLFPAFMSPDGSLIWAIEGQRRVVAFDTTTWELVASWQAHESAFRGHAFSPDGASLVTTAEDNTVAVWDVSNIREPETPVPPLVDRIPAPKPSDAIWLDNERLAILLADGARWLEVSLGPEGVVAIARDRLTRGFTPEECAEYGIEDCPMTLEEIRNRG